MRLLTCAFFLLFCCSSITFAADKNLETKVQELEQRIEKLEKMLSPPAKTTTATTTAPTNDCLLQLKDWQVTYGKNSITGYYQITYEISNNYKKTVKLIDGGIDFKDLLGETMYSIKIRPDVLVKPSEAMSNTGKFRINEYINEQTRMKDMNKKDIIPELNIRKIVFDDNSIMEL